MSIESRLCCESLTFSDTQATYSLLNVRAGSTLMHELLCCYYAVIYSSHCHDFNVPLASRAMQKKSVGIEILDVDEISMSC